ncbi:TcpE family conjugal transfer membrane protein [Nocardiopsis sp. LOL_012]|uniref:TcpE family conjugal transfer membrane protein n=1 Tax=Nocardiopsis sp. LOL_012 TaxID=3345409 RepID=UPI003A84B8BF
MTPPQGASEQPGLLGRSYTKARRYPWMIGKIQGWTLPLGPFTGLQIGVLVTSLWLLVQTAHLWAGLGPLAVLPLCLPVAATWAVRHAHIEGRPPLRALAGYLALLTAPRQGTIGGRPATALTPRPTRLTGALTIEPATTPEPAPEQPSPDPGLRAAPRPRPTTLRDLLTPAPDHQEQE